MNQATELKREFERRYGGAARVFRAPGRVNLIGEHTDYNDGFVLPAAIGLATWAAIAPRDDRRLAVYSEQQAEGVEFDLDEPQPQPQRHWSDYVRGVAVGLERIGHRLRGANLLIRSDVPLGAGLSSSAALEVAVGYALLSAAGLAVDRLALAQACRTAEQEFAGTRCGIMDQFIACFGQAGRALLLDCRSLAHRLLPLPADVRLVVCNTMVKHELAAGEYNTRRAECEAGVRTLAAKLPRVSALRDVTPAELEAHGDELPAVIRRRCRHVVGENERVVRAAAALECGDLRAFGDLMAASHRSLRDDYEVSCAELDLLVELANEVEGVIDARMTGGGFGGCTINLVAAPSVALFARRMATAYEAATGRRPEIYICEAAAGVAEVEADNGFYSGLRSCSEGWW